MKSGSNTIYSAIKTASGVARKRAYRKGLPVAVSKKGKVFLIYKDNREVEVRSGKASKLK